MIDTISLGVASELTNRIERKVKTSKIARNIKEKFNIKEYNELAIKITSTAITDALNQVKQSGEAIETFLKDPVNKSIIATWIEDPDLFYNNSKNLNKQGAINEIEIKNLELFISILHEKIINLRRVYFPPYVFQIINELEKQNEVLKDIQDKVTWITGSLSANAEILLKDKTGSSNTTINQVSESELSDISSDEIEDLIKVGKLSDARILAHECLKQNSSLKKADKSRLNKLIAITYLKNESEQTKAIPYLKESIKYQEDIFKAKRDEALINIIDQEQEAALNTTEKLIGIKVNADSINLRVNAFWLSNKYEEALEFLKSVDQSDDHRWHYNISFTYYLLGNWPSSLEHLEKAIEIKGDYFEALKLYTEVVAIEYQSSFDTRKSTVPTDGERYKLERSIDYLTKIINEVDEQSKDFHFQCLANRGLIKFWLGDDIESLNDLTKAGEFYPHDKIVLSNLARVNSTLGKLENALKATKKILELENYDSTIVRLHAQLLIESGDSEQAIKFIQNHASDELKPEELTLHTLKVLAYNKVFETNLADKLVDDLLKEFPDNVEVHITKSNHLKTLGHYDEALETLAKVDDKAVGKFELLALLEKADIHFKKGTVEDFKIASELYEEINVLTSDEFITRRLALSYFNSKNLIKCIELCNEVQSEQPDRLYTELEARIYYHTENFVAAKENFKWLSFNFSSNVDYSVKYSVCLYRIGERDKAFEVIRQIAKDVKDSAENLLSIAHTYANFGETLEAAKFSHKAIKYSSDNALIHAAYLQLWFNFILPSSAKIPREYSATFNQILSQYKAKFPDQNHFFFKKIEFDINDTDSIVESLLENLPAEDDKLYLEQLFKERAYPVSFLSNITGKDIFTTWKLIISNSDYGFVSNTGNQEDIKKEVRIINESETIVIDSTALFTIFQFDLVQELCKTFKKIFVPQRLMDILFNQIEQEKRLLESGGMTIYSVNGGIVRSDIPSKTITEKIHQLDTIINEIAENDTFELIGKSINRSASLDTDQKNQIIDSFDEITKEVIFETDHRKSVLYSDELYFRMFLKENFEGNSFSTISLAEVFLKNKLISKEEYEKVLFDLLIFGYKTINFNSSSLFRFIERHGYQTNAEILVLFESIKKGDYSSKSLLAVGLQLLKKIWDNIEIESERIKWTNIVLNTLSEKESKNMVAKFFLAKANLIFHKIDVVKKEKFLNAVNSWREFQLIL